MVVLSVPRRRGVRPPRLHVFPLSPRGARTRGLLAGDGHDEWRHDARRDDAKRIRGRDDERWCYVRIAAHGDGHEDIDGYRRDGEGEGEGRRDGTHRLLGTLDGSETDVRIRRQCNEHAVWAAGWSRGECI